MPSSSADSEHQSCMRAYPLDLCEGSVDVMCDGFVVVLSLINQPGAGIKASNASTDLLGLCRDPPSAAVFASPGSVSDTPCNQSKLEPLACGLSFPGSVLSCTWSLYE